MAYGSPPAIRTCTKSDHPARRHGHYGGITAHWCTDLRSPLMSEENGAHVERGWIVLYERPTEGEADGR